MSIMYRIKKTKQIKYVLTYHPVAGSEPYPLPVRALYEEQPHGSSKSASANTQAQPPPPHHTNPPHHATPPHHPAPPHHVVAPPPHHPAAPPPHHLHTITWLLTYCCWKNSPKKVTC
jgi:hypothetical protein